MRLRCKACGGIYDDVDREGVLYFHVCPPEPFLVVDFSARGIVQQPLASFAGVVLCQSEAEQRELVLQGVELTTIGIVRERHDRPRANHRDENTATRDGVDRSVRVIKSFGAGVEELAAGAELPERGRRVI